MMFSISVCMMFSISVCMMFSIRVAILPQNCFFFRCFYPSEKRDTSKTGTFLNLALAPLFEGQSQRSRIGLISLSPMETMGVDQPDGTLVVAQAQMEQSIKQQELSANLRTIFFGVSRLLGERVCSTYFC